MLRTTPWLAAALLGSSAAAGGAQARHPLISLPLDDPAYVQLDGLEKTGCRVARISPHRPYPVLWIRAALDTARSEPRCAGPLLDALVERFAVTIDVDSTRLDGIRLGAALTLGATAIQEGEFRPLWAEVRDPAAGTPPVVGTLRGRLTWSTGRSAVVVAEGYGQTHRRNDPHVRGMPFRRTSGVVDVSEAYVAGMAGPFLLSFGRVEEAWLGNGRESLVLSAHGPSLDRIAASVRWRTIEARALFGVLSTVDLDPERDSLALAEPLRVYRYLAGHALTWRISRRIELTLGETALLSRRGPAPDFTYANPLIPFLLVENDTARALEGNDNNLVLFGAMRVGLGNAMLEAELHVDDVQIDSQDRTEVPDQLGWRFQGTVPLPGVWPTSLSATYTRIGGYTYLREAYSSVYQWYDLPLGSELGPDADRGTVSMTLWPRGTMRLRAELGRWRRGAQRIDDRPSVSMVGHAGEPYPTRTAARPAVQGAWTAGAQMDLLGSTLPLGVSVEAARIDNANNQPANSTLYLRAHLVATYRFRYP
jgi:hypothetical protein